MRRTQAAAAPSIPTPTPAGKRKPGRPSKADLAAQEAAERATRPRVSRPVERAPMRPGGVVGRNGEIITRDRTLSGFFNDWDVPEQFKQDGWSYQWVMLTCHGKEFTNVYSNHYANGWRPVQREYNSGLFDYFSAPAAARSIEREGQVLCERPQELNKEALADGYQDAVSLRQAQAEGFGRRKLPKYFKEGGVSRDGEFNASRKVVRENPITITAPGMPNFKPQYQYAGPDSDE